MAAHEKARFKICFEEIRDCSSTVPVHSWFLIDYALCASVSDVIELIKNSFGLYNLEFDLFLDDALLPPQMPSCLIRENDTVRLKLLGTPDDIRPTEVKSKRLKKKKKRKHYSDDDSGEEYMTKREKKHSEVPQQSTCNEKHNRLSDSQCSKEALQNETSRNESIPQVKNNSNKSEKVFINTDSDSDADTTNSQFVIKEKKSEKDVTPIGKINEANSVVLENKKDISSEKKPKRKRKRHRKKKESSDTLNNALTSNVPKPIEPKRKYVPSKLMMTKSSGNHIYFDSEQSGSDDNDVENVLDETNAGDVKNVLGETNEACDDTGGTVDVEVKQRKTVISGNGNESYSTTLSYLIADKIKQLKGEENSPKKADITHNENRRKGKQKKNMQPAFQVFTRTKKHYKELSKEEQINSVQTNVSTVLQNSPASSASVIENRETPKPNITRQDTEQETHPPKDYSSYPSLEGAPRTGDKVAYKMVELSDDYCPVISEYKEAKVISVSSLHQTVQLQELTKAVKKKRLGKFDIADNETEEDTADPGQDNIIECTLSSLMEVKLLT